MKCQRYPYDLKPDSNNPSRVTPFNEQPQRLCSFSDMTEVLLQFEVESRGELHSLFLIHCVLRSMQTLRESKPILKAKIPNAC